MLSAVHIVIHVYLVKENEMRKNKKISNKQQLKKRQKQKKRLVQEELVFYHNSIVLNTELQISADFIFDGLNSFINLTYNQSHSESKIFGAFYSLSVGIERLQKVILSLAYNVTANDKKDEYSKRINKAFYGHNHQSLANVLEDYTGIKNYFSKEQNKFLEKLMTFYKDERYSKYHQGTHYDSMIIFYTGEQIMPFQYNEKYFDALDSIFSNIQSILYFYYSMIEQLQKGIKNFLGETGSDTKLFTLQYYSLNLKNYFQLFNYAWYEFIYSKSDNPHLGLKQLPLKNTFFDSHHLLVKSDFLYNGNGEYAVNWLVEYYTCQKNIEWASKNYEIFYNKKENFNSMNKMTHEILEYYKERHIFLSSI